MCFPRSNKMKTNKRRRRRHSRPPLKHRGCVCTRIIMCSYPAKVDKKRGGKKRGKKVKKKSTKRLLYACFFSLVFIPLINPSSHRLHQFIVRCNFYHLSTLSILASSPRSKSSLHPPPPAATAAAAAAAAAAVVFPSTFFVLFLVVLSSFLLGPRSHQPPLTLLFTAPTPHAALPWWTAIWTWSESGSRASAAPPSQPRGPAPPASRG